MSDRAALAARQGQPFGAGEDGIGIAGSDGLGQFLLGKRTVAAENGEIDDERRGVEHGAQGGGGVRQGHGVEQREPFRRAAFAKGRAQIKELAAADGASGGDIAQDEAVERGGRNRPVEDQLNPGVPTRRDRPLQRHDADIRFRAAMMQASGKPFADRLRFGGEHGKLRIDARRGRMQGRIDHHVATRYRLFRNAVAGKIEGAALAGDAALGLFVLGMDGAHPRRKGGGADDYLIADRDRT